MEDVHMETLTTIQFQVGSQFLGSGEASNEGIALFWHHHYVVAFLGIKP
jgi:hypothetical protein